MEIVYSRLMCSLEAWLADQTSIARNRTPWNGTMLFRSRLRLRRGTNEKCRTTDGIGASLYVVGHDCIFLVVQSRSLSRPPPGPRAPASNSTNSSRTTFTSIDTIRRTLAPETRMIIRVQSHDHGPDTATFKVISLIRRVCSERLRLGQGPRDVDTHRSRRPRVRDSVVRQGCTQRRVYDVSWPPRDILLDDVA